MTQDDLTREVERRLRSAPDGGALLERTTVAALIDLGAVEVRRQLSGTQFGLDIWARIPNYQGVTEIWKLECKNLNRPITLDDVAPKLIWHVASTTIDCLFHAAGRMSHIYMYGVTT